MICILILTSSSHAGLCTLILTFSETANKIKSQSGWHIKYNPLKIRKAQNILNTWQTKSLSDSDEILNEWSDSNVFISSHTKYGLIGFYGFFYYFKINDSYSVAFLLDERGVLHALDSTQESLKIYKPSDSETIENLEFLKGFNQRSQLNIDSDVFYKHLPYTKIENFNYFEHIINLIQRNVRHRKRLFKFRKKMDEREFLMGYGWFKQREFFHLSEKRKSL